MKHGQMKRLQIQSFSEEKNLLKICWFGNELKSTTQEIGKKTFFFLRPQNMDFFFFFWNLRQVFKIIK